MRACMRTKSPLDPRRRSLILFARVPMERYKALAPILILLAVVTLQAQDSSYEPQGEQIPGPRNAMAADDHCCAGNGETPVPVATWKAWLVDIRHYRNERLIRAGYRSSEYDRPELKWTQSAFIQPQMMIEDRYFYDPGLGRYTVDRSLDDLQKRYGGIDSVLLWHTYTNIGVDGRNQYDLL